MKIKKEKKISEGIYEEDEIVPITYVSINKNNKISYSEKKPKWKINSEKQKKKEG